jgi:hypothetical protein
VTVKLAFWFTSSNRNSPGITVTDSPSGTTTSARYTDLVAPALVTVRLIVTAGRSSVSATTIEALLRSFASVLSMPAQRTAGAGKMIRFTWSSV